MARVRHSSQIDRYLPLAGLVLAMALFVGLMPSALRPPPDRSTESAEFSPDAPPDENQEAIVAALNRGTTGTAGDGEGAGVRPVGEVPQGEPPEPAPPPNAPPRSCPGGFGDPPRQTDSLYSAPCAPAFVGDNGGATYKNVTRNEVRVGFRHTVGNARDDELGPVEKEPYAGESTAHRTLRVLQAYFNQNFQLYGRELRLVQLPDEANFEADPPDQRAAAQQADKGDRLFAAYTLGASFQAEFARRRLVTFANPLTRERYERDAPYRWSWMTDLNTLDEVGAELACKQLKDKPAEYAGPTLEENARVLGIIDYNTEAQGGRPSSVFRDAYQAACGGRIERSFDFDDNNEDRSDAYATAVTQMRADGVTTIVLNTWTSPAAQAMAAASAQGYFPEWLVFSPYGLDFNTVPRLFFPPEQRAHLFGFSGWELPRPASETDCWTAYRSIDPNNDPNASTCGILFGDLLQMVNGMQAAGPRLTPETFRDGLFSIGHRFFDDPVWAVGGGFGPGDYSYQDNFGFIWWDNTARDFGGEAGAYRWVHGGKRYRKGGIPDDPFPFFEDGVTGTSGR